MDAVAICLDLARPVLAFHHNGDAAESGYQVQALEFGMNAVSSGIDAVDCDGNSVGSAAEDGVKIEARQIEGDARRRMDAGSCRADIPRFDPDRSDTGFSIDAPGIVGGNISDINVDIPDAGNSDKVTSRLETGTLYPGIHTRIVAEYIACGNIYVSGRIGCIDALAVADERGHILDVDVDVPHAVNGK